ncbi:hypothetical protein BgiBS90_012203, partial [Biomphalaria glabrata]
MDHIDVIADTHVKNGDVIGSAKKSHKRRAPDRPEPFHSLGPEFGPNYGGSFNGSLPREPNGSASRIEQHANRSEQNK